VYYARLIIEAENEIMERKIVEIDARPSDCLALCARTGAPVYVVAELWEKLDDMSAILEEMRRKGMEPGED
jgi:bifunctional DNase/RNase